MLTDGLDSTFTNNYNISQPKPSLTYELLGSMFWDGPPPFDQIEALNFVVRPESGVKKITLCMNCQPLIIPNPTD